MQSSQTFGSPRSFITSHKQLLHLKPAPKLIMNTVSPFFNLFFASMYDNTYHKLLADVFPKRCSVILAGSRSYSLRSKLNPMPSITAFPPVCKQKWSTPVLKFNGDLVAPVIADLGVLFLFTFLISDMNKNLSNSRTGNILGAMTRRLSTKARVAALGSVFPRWNPSLPCSSSRWTQQP